MSDTVKPEPQSAASENARTAPIENPRDGATDKGLFLCRLDDRGDLVVYVWGDNATDASDGAEEYAQAQGWEVDEDDLAIFEVPGTSADFAHVFFRSTLLAE